MANTYKVLGQSNPGAATLTTLYTVPGATQSIVSSLIIANRSATPTTFRIALRVAGAAIADSQYIAYDAPIGANEVIPFTLGIGLQATDIISVYATLATLTFTATGVQIT